MTDAEKIRVVQLQFRECAKLLGGLPAPLNELAKYTQDLADRLGVLEKVVAIAARPSANLCRRPN